MVRKRIWLNANKQLQYSLFQNSDYYVDFKRRRGATAGYDVWRYVLARVGSFVSKPLAESCVDEKISGLEHYMAALLGFVKTDRVRSFLENYKDKTKGLTYKQLLETLRKAGAYQMIEAVCCPKVEEPDLQYDKKGCVQKLYRWLVLMGRGATQKRNA